MESLKFSVITVFHLLTILSIFNVQCAQVNKKSYIVYLGAHNHESDFLEAEDIHSRVTESHHEFLGSFLGSKDKAKESLLNSYKWHINGFAAFLDEDEAAEIAKHPKVLSVLPNREIELHTTRTWGYMMLEDAAGNADPDSIWGDANNGKNAIIANIDSGVWPTSASFNDAGYGSVPAGWKGSCGNGTYTDGFTCNKKLIGAKYYSKGFLALGGTINSSHLTPRDHHGHGTHTLSTAAGSFVKDVSYNGLAKGKAKGGAPGARVATYKACWPTPDRRIICASSDVLKAMDDAIADGVNIISLSIGTHTGTTFEDAISIGAFHAMLKDIVVICSAGNNGPEIGTVTNIPPWIITVAASRFDRRFPAQVILSNNVRLTGQSISPAFPASDRKSYKLITGANAKNLNASESDAKLCKAGSLDPAKVSGKIVVCERGETPRIQKGREAMAAGAVGLILYNDISYGNQTEADPHVLPASHVSHDDGLFLLSYINSTENPVAKLNPPSSNVSNLNLAPVMAPFSSLGPNPVTPEILKPDVTAPGVLVLGAYTEAHSFSSEYNETIQAVSSTEPKTPYVLMSGTSVSAPHVAGVAALVRSINPYWSVAAIRSAIATTSRSRANNGVPIRDSKGLKATPFHYGHGHLRPNRAANPGLVYDVAVYDYLDFLCALGYNQTAMKGFYPKNYTCPSEKMALTDFNYPSITVPKLNRTITVKRTLTNVARPAVYTVRVTQPSGFSVNVEPKVLEFETFGQQLSFTVTIKDKRRTGSKDFFFGRFIWSSDTYQVRSPISVARA